MRNKLKLGIIAFVLLLSATALLADNHIIDVTDDTSEVKEIEVRSQGMRFTVTEIRVNLGDTIRLTYVNGGGRHDWALAEYNIWTEVITGGQSDTIEFVADKAGDFEFYCGVPGHRQAGMVGRFIVVDPDA
ncbi:MAG: hypothetical protein EA382_18335 [Spirochaetaceae bacterium]|nr:MAG: hypothetical protein EA382_18335 [Spirochaetaceae bacterium]